MIDDFDQSISELVKQDYRTADVFKKYQLSFCCSGATPLRSACESRGLDFELLSDELQQSTRDILLPNHLPYNEWKIDFLIDFIINIHHSYIYRVIPQLAVALESFTLGHGKKYPELTEVTGIFSRLSEILLIHNRREDEIIFPYIKQIDSAYRRNETYGNLFVKTLRKPLQAVESEHLQIQELLTVLKTTSGHFSPPAKTCLSYQVLYKKLEEVYNNLIQHKFLEHTILFPKAITIERNLLLL